MLFVAIVIVMVAATLAMRLSHRSRLRDLPEESRERYAKSWHGVEERFGDDPAEAVGEADRIVVMMLGEQGATLSDPRSVPEELRQAREAAAGDTSGHGAEGMREAIVHYRRMVNRGVGASHMKEADQRTVVAS